MNEWPFNPDFLKHYRLQTALLSPGTCTRSYHTMGPDFSSENCGHYRNSAVVPKLRSLDSQGKS